MYATDRNIRLLYAFWFLRDFQLWIPVWIVYLTINQGFSLTQVTGAEGLFLVAVVLLEVPTGAVADRWGRTISLGLGAMVLAACVLIFAFTTSFAVLVGSFLLWSVAQTLMSGADMALLFDSLKASGREAQFERFAGRGSAMNWGGAGLATFMGGPVAAVLDIKATILIGVVTCLAAAAVAFLIAEPPHTRDENKESYVSSIRGAFGEAWRVPELRAVILLSGATFASLEAIGYLVQPYLIERGVEVGVLFSMLQVPLLAAGALGALVANRLVGGTRAGPLLLVVPMVGLVSYVVLAASPGLTGYLALPIVFALAASLNPIAVGYINRRIGSERRATVLSIQGMVSSLTMAGLAAALGFIADERGLTWAFIASAAATGTALLLLGAPLLRMLTRPAAGPRRAEG